MSQTVPHRLLVDYLHALIAQLDIPEFAKRIALNFRVLDYYQSRVGFHPVEIQLERQPKQSEKQPWRLVFIASFSYPDEQAVTLDVELYFNFLRGWFYQPDIERCDLHQPQVTDLYQSYERSFLKQIQQCSFDDIQATLVKIDTPAKPSIP